MGPEVVVNKKRASITKPSPVSWDEPSEARGPGGGPPQPPNFVDFSLDKANSLGSLRIEQSVAGYSFAIRKRDVQPRLRVSLFFCDPG